MEKPLNLHETDAYFHGAPGIERDRETVAPARLPTEELPLCDPRLAVRARETSGVRLTMLSDTRSALIELDPVQPEAGWDHWAIDLLVDGEFAMRVNQPRSEGLFRFEQIPGSGERLLTFYLYHHAPARIRQVAIDSRATARPWTDPRPRWIAYGSSLTHCGAAAGPSETWPAIAARACDLNLTNMGFGGQCHMDICAARTIRDLPADAISLCMGVNIIGSSTMSERTFRSNAIGFVQLIREKHPTTPIVVTTPIYASRADLYQPNAAEMSLSDVSALLAEAVKLLRDRGDGHLHLVDGHTIFGPADEARLADRIHPDADGYRLMGQRYAERVMPVLGFPPRLAIPRTAR